MQRATSSIVFDNVSKRYPGSSDPALDHVSLDVAAGEFLCVVGASGSGKSTLLRLANRLIAPDTGTVQIEGKDIAQADPVALRRRVGYVFQSGALFPHMTVEDNIGITPRLLDQPQQAIAGRVTELLKLVQLPDNYRSRYPAALSGGEQQRVGVARALAARPSIMLMDEPFGALDPLTRDRLGDDYRALHRDLGLTTVMITHDMTEAMLLADRIAVLKHGRLIAQGTPAALAASTEPHVAELMHTPRRQAARLRAALAGTAP
jgi:osmoprotectant transport system ATP-binding protein